MLGNLLIANLHFIALLQQLAVLNVFQLSIREPITSKTLTVGAVPLLLYDLGGSAGKQVSGTSLG